MHSAVASAAHSVTAHSATAHSAVSQRRTRRRREATHFTVDARGAAEHSLGWR